MELNWRLGIAALFLALAPISADAAPNDVFAATCHEIYNSHINNGKDDVCIIGIAAHSQIIPVYAMQPILAGGSPVNVYESMVTEQGTRPLQKLSDCKGRLVAIAGFANGGAVYNAVFVAGGSPLLNAALLSSSHFPADQIPPEATQSKAGC